MPTMIVPTETLDNLIPGSVMLTRRQVASHGIEVGYHYNSYVVVYAATVGRATSKSILSIGGYEARRRVLEAKLSLIF